MQKFIPIATIRTCELPNSSLSMRTGTRTLCAYDLLPSSALVGSPYPQRAFLSSHTQIARTRHRPWRCFLHRKLASCRAQQDASASGCRLLLVVLWHCLQTQQHSHPLSGWESTPCPSIWTFVRGDPYIKAYIYLRDSNRIIHWKIYHVGHLSPTNEFKVEHWHVCKSYIF